MDDRNAYSTAVFCIAIATLLFPLQEVVADAGSYGVLAGRTASMLHPMTNFALFATSLYSAYLGFQWRRLRDIGEDIKTLGSQLPSISSGKLKFPVGPTALTIAESISALQSGGSEVEAQIALLRKDLSVVNSAAEIDAQIAALTATRKDLLSLNLRDKHHQTGSVLLGAGVTVSVLGAFNTYMRAGRLFPGPHLYAGMAITILWAGELVSCITLCLVVSDCLSCLLLSLSFLESSGCVAGSGHAEGQRAGQVGAHRAQRGERAPLRMADSNGHRDHAQGLGEDLVALGLDQGPGGGAGRVTHVFVSSNNYVIKQYVWQVFDNEGEG